MRLQTAQEDFVWKDPMTYLSRSDHISPVKPHEPLVNPASLCGRCMTLFEELDREPAESQFLTVVLHNDLQSLHLSNSRRCRLCIPFFARLNDWQASNHTTEPIEVVCDFWKYNTAKENYLCMKIRLSEFMYTSHGPETCYFFQKESACPRWFTLAENGRDTSSEEAFRSIEAWFDNCIKSHAGCTPKYYNDFTQYPSRLVDVGTLSRPRLKLCVTSEELVQGPYITLSHCWGKGLVFRLLVSNFNQLRKAIPYSLLPKTFQDAVTVARKIHVRYLWIDALCIIQDSPGTQDWLLEAPKMAQIYGNALACIAATWASSGEQGLFSRRKDDFLAVEMTWKSWGINGRYIMGNLDMTTDLVEASPLNRRGWVLQERVLSPRVLQYANGHIFWECRHSSGCEMAPWSVPTSDRQFSQGWQSPRIDVSRQYGSNEAQELYKLWISLCRFYSGTSLTKPTDRLVAISGIAEVLGNHFKDEYIAGLWKKTIVTEIAWFAREPARTPRSPKHPSFSWACLNVPIDWWAVQYYYPFRSLEYLVETSVLSLGSTSDMYSHSQTGSCILIKGTLIRAYLGDINFEQRRAYTMRTKHYFAPKTIGFQQELRFQVLAEVSLDIQPDERAIEATKNFNFETAMELLCLPLFKYNGTEIEGIIVEHVNAKDDKIYRRNGWFRVSELQSPDFLGPPKTIAPEDFMVDIELSLV